MLNCRHSILQSRENLQLMLHPNQGNITHNDLFIYLFRLQLCIIPCRVGVIVFYIEKELVWNIIWNALLKRHCKGCNVITCKLTTQPQIYNWNNPPASCVHVSRQFQFQFQFPCKTVTANNHFMSDT